VVTQSKAAILSRKGIRKKTLWVRIRCNVGWNPTLTAVPVATLEVLSKLQKGGGQTHTLRVELG